MRVTNDPGGGRRGQKKSKNKLGKIILPQRGIHRSESKLRNTIQPIVSLVPISVEALARLCSGGLVIA